MADVNQASLLEYLDRPQVNCLNESVPGSLKDILTSPKTQSGQVLQSDADEQLLLTIAFNQSVRIRSLAIQSSVPEEAPKKIKIFINKSSIGFEDVEDDAAAAQILDLTPENVANGERVQLRFVRFQKVNSIHIFVESNQGDADQTRIDSIEVFGAPAGGATDLSTLKKVEE